MPLCEVCSSITLELLLPSAIDSKQHGFLVASDLDALRQRIKTCDLCDLLYQTLSSLPVPSVFPADGGVWLSGVVTAVPAPGENLDATQMSGAIVACNGRSTTLNICQKTDANPLAGRLIPENMDPPGVAAFVTTQLAGCQGPGHARCQQVLTGQAIDPNYVPPRLWSVTRNCLVDTNSSNVTGVKYVALSYVWDKSVWNVRTLTSNLADRQVTKTAEKAHGDWPAVYTAAMAITRALQREYLWIDALCIVQDDAKDQRVHFKGYMNKIYQNSLVTICAIVEGAGTDPMQARVVTQQCVGFVDDKYWVTPRIGKPAHDVGVATPGAEQPKWAMRGWPFQERVLPSKCIMLTPHQMYWECRTVLREEGGMVHPPIVYKRDTAGQPQRNWQQMVRDYTRRTLSRKSDKIPAVLGIMRQLAGNTMEAAVEFGFLTPRIARDLLWESGGGPKSVSLTQLELAPGETPQVPQPCPWSWAFWEGTIDFESYLESAALTPNTAYTVDSTGELNITGAVYTEMRGGATMDDKAVGGPTDIVHTVIHNNVTSLMEPPEDGEIRGWIAFDRDPGRAGVSVDEKKGLVCIKVSTTSWGPDPVHPTHHAANVLVVQRCGGPIAHAGIVARVGVGQLWDENAMKWTSATSPFRVGTPPKTI